MKLKKRPPGKVERHDGERVPIPFDEALRRVVKAPEPVRSKPKSANKKVPSKN